VTPPIVSSTLARNTNMTVVGSTTSPATNVTVNSVATIRYTNDNTFARTSKWSSAGAKPSSWIAKAFAGAGAWAQSNFGESCSVK